MRCSLFTGTVPVRCFLFTGTWPVNNLFRVWWFGAFQNRKNKKNVFKNIFATFKAPWKFPAKGEDHQTIAHLISSRGTLVHFYFYLGYDWRRKNHEMEKKAPAMLFRILQFLFFIKIFNYFEINVCLCFNFFLLQFNCLFKFFIECFHFYLLYIYKNMNLLTFLP